MGYNIRTGQLKGAFKANTELFTEIKNDASIDVKYVKHIGIQAPASTVVALNKKEYEIGKTGVYEIGNSEITSIYFLEDTDDKVIIDYTIE